MTAQHPQNTLEQLQKLYRDHQERLHTPPQAADDAEMRQWQRQEEYGAPLPPVYKVGKGLMWGFGVLFAINLGGNILNPGSSPDLAGQNVLFLQIFLVLAVVTWALKLASSERYYTSRFVRGWANFLKGLGWCIAGWMAAQALHQPKGTSYVPGHDPAVEQLRAMQPQPVVLKDFQGYNLPTPGGWPR